MNSPEGDIPTVPRGDERQTVDDQPDDSNATNETPEVEFVDAEDDLPLKDIEPDGVIESEETVESKYILSKKPHVN